MTSRRARALRLLVAAALATTLLPFGPPPASAVTITSCSGVRLNPGDDIQAALDRNPAGTTFCLSPGEYRLTQALLPKSDQRIIGLGTQEARLIGARVVTPIRSGSNWVIRGQSSLGTSSFAELESSKQCRAINGREPGLMCIQRDQVFINDVALWQVDRLSRVIPGTFYWDAASNRIFIRNDPTGRRVEVSVAPTAAIRAGGATGVTVQNVVIEKFGNGVSSGALQAGTAWTVIDNRITNNHGAGLHVEPGVVAQRNSIVRNGQLGVHGGGAGQPILIEDNDISFNNTVGYSWTWEAGGTKFVRTDALQLRGNTVRSNNGPGFWLDIENVNSLVENNTVTSNISAGIYHEIGGAAIIRNNVVTGNGFQEPTQGRAFGAGILVGESFDVEIYGNTVENNMAGITAVQRSRGTGAIGPREVRNLFVHDNRIQQSTGIAAGLQILDNMGDGFFSMNNRWENNSYTLGNATSGLHFMWTGGLIRFSTWRNHGHDDGRL